MNYFIVTYGCQANISDSEKISAVLENSGYLLSLNLKNADLILINACSVRQSAIDRIWGQLKILDELKIVNKKLKTVLTGCVLKADRKKFRQKFDYILDINELKNWPGLIENKEKQPEASAAEYLNILPKRGSSFQAFVPISTGCNNLCSYCAVPHTRGSLVCRDHQEVLKEIRTLVAKGFKEIWLLGQNVNNYRSVADKTFDFTK